MSIRIPDECTMTSDVTPHTATAWPVPGEPTLWSVTWLPGRALTRNQAVSAMMLAETVSRGIEPGTRMWIFVNGWAAELGLTGEEAATLARRVPDGAR
jgi:hypothetical protein